MGQGPARFRTVAGERVKACRSLSPGLSLFPGSVDQAGVTRADTVPADAGYHLPLTTPGLVAEPTKRVRGAITVAVEAPAETEPVAVESPAETKPVTGAVKPQAVRVEAPA